MIMKLFNDYLNGISDILTKSQTTFFSDSINERRSFQALEKAILLEGTAVQQANKKNKTMIDFDQSQLVNLFGHNPYSFQNVSIGTHPDFADLEYNKYEYHYCVSMFMDIKGSTRLNEKYSLPEIRRIKDTVLTLAIHVATHFGGHVHRMQGDGIFLQFVRKGQEEENAVINALNAASVLAHFISTDLAGIFNQNGVKPLRVRIGIDLGYEKDVLWSHYGIPLCSELTTTSLHTDLAAKLQAQAESNGILVGGNIKDILDIKDEFCCSCLDSENNTDYYIYQGSAMNYRKYKFDWKKYLNSYDFYRNSTIDTPNIRLVCKITEPQSTYQKDYYQNSSAIKKETKIQYTIMENGHPYYKKDWEAIEWKAYNSGKEAANTKDGLTHDFGGAYKNKTICETSAAYVGHHYVECTIKREHLDNIKLRFPIFVK